MTVGLDAILVLSVALFATGLFGLVARRTILFQLLALEVMLTGPALAFVAAGAHHGVVTGQGMFVLVLSLAAAEVAIGLALYVRLSRAAGSADSDDMSGLRG
jgi:NADH-quinone oxidoreductase subunit K